MFDEVQSNWVRERASARAGQRVAEHYDAVISHLRDVSRALSTSKEAEARVASAQDLLQRMQSETESYREEREAERQSLELVDLFVLVRVLAEEWAAPVRAAGVDVAMRVAERGPVLLMHRSNVVDALANILGVLANHLSKGDKALIECTATANRAIIRIADTAERADGTLLARLFMPSANAGDDDPQSALSIAGDIIQRHGGEITVRSSPGWRTILQISFPVAANSDRRGRRDRRKRPRDRREQP
jgi:signal transduction histidine kinase